MVELIIQPNEFRCASTEHEHVLELPVCCPYSNNPRPGSTITISYKGSAGFLDVRSTSHLVIEPSQIMRATCCAQSAAARSANGG